MGLDISHDCWSGAYSAFHRWRKEIAKAGGIPLEAMEGFFGGHIEDCINVVADRITLGRAIQRFAEDNLPVKWESLRPDILHVLLNHSDCGGKIEHKNCEPLADRLEKILPRLPEGDGGGHIGNWRAKTQTFIDGLRRAHDAGEDVEFY